MKRNLRVAALMLLVAATGVWLAAGANRGWTKTKISKKVLDEVTGIEGVTYENGFVPGIDFLGAAVVGTGILAGVSFLIRDNKTKM